MTTLLSQSLCCRSVPFVDVSNFSGGHLLYDAIYIKDPYSKYPEAEVVVSIIFIDSRNSGSFHLDSR